jgi:hypothetical protein
MLVSGFISVLRRRYNDLPTKHQDTRTGDGSSTIYKTQFAPIKESSYKQYINNSLIAASGYTIDLDTGDLVLIAATSNEIKSQYQEVKFRDQHWLEAIQSAVDAMGDQFFRSTIGDVSSMHISADVQKYNCPSSCIKLTEVLESSTSTLSGSWVKPKVNTRYDRRSNVLVFGSKPTKANYLLISYLRKINRPSAVTSALDVEDAWLQLLDLKAGAIFFRSQAAKIAQQGNATVEEGHLSMAQLRALANDNEILFENLKKKLKPIMPASEVPFYIHGGGTTF